MCYSWQDFETGEAKGPERQAEQQGATSKEVGEGAIGLPCQVLITGWLLSVTTETK